jgi:hypothetical protein
MFAAGDALDNLETLLNSILLKELMQRGVEALANLFVQSAPSLHFGPQVDMLLGSAGPLRALCAWRQLNAASPELLKCVWRGTERSARPSAVSLFEVALFDQHYQSAISLVLAFCDSAESRASFVGFLSRQDPQGDTM